MFCSACGCEVAEGTAFCGNCGAPLDGGVSTAANPSPSSPDDYSGASDIATGTSSKKKKGKAPLIILLIALVVIAIAAVTIRLTMCADHGMTPSEGSAEVGSVTSSGVSSETSNAITPKDAVEAYTWSELSEISKEIGDASDESAAIEVAKKYNLVTKDGKLDGTQTKTLTLTNGETATVQIAGFSHDDKTSGGKAGITFVFKDCVEWHAMNPRSTNTGGWENSSMRSYLASDVMKLMPDDLKAVIVPVEKLTNNTGQANSVSSVTKTSDALWLLSPVEVCGTISRYSGSNAIYNDIFNAEGSEYKLFHDMNVRPTELNAFLVKSFRGTSIPWWMRSPDPSRSDSFCDVYADGNPSHRNVASNLYGIVPGFCI